MPMKLNVRTLGIAATFSMLAFASTQAEEAKPEPQMQTVLDALNALQAKPFHTLSVADARAQASAADCVKRAFSAVRP